MPTATEVEAPPSTSRRERRAHVRHNSSDLPAIRSSRLKSGPSVSLIDLSVGGALIEADVQLRPGTRLALELASGSDAPSLVPMRVLRCEVATIRAESTIYRGACEFVRPLEWPMLMAEPVVAVPAPSQPQRPFIGIDASLKILAERSRSGAAGGTLKTADVVKVLDALRLRAGQLDHDQLAGPIAELLPTVSSALERRDPAEVVLAEIEARLRAALPRLDIRLADAPLPGASGAESLIFRPEQATDLACVLNVQVPTGTTLTDWQFRLLKASMHLCSLLDAAGLRPSAGPRLVSSSWQKLVVRYKDGRLVKGFSHDFNPTRSQFAIWPSINAPEHEGILVPIAVLKAVFFVRDFRGDSSYVEDRSFEQAPHGRKVEVTFADDEVVIGTTLSYRPDGQGFFLNPADPRANNIRIFVVTSAVRHVRFLGGATTDQPAARPLQLVG